MLLNFHDRTWNGHRLEAWSVFFVPISLSQNTEATKHVIGTSRGQIRIAFKVALNSISATSFKPLVPGPLLVSQLYFLSLKTCSARHFSTRKWAAVKQSVYIWWSKSLLTIIIRRDQHQLIHILNCVFWKVKLLSWLNLNILLVKPFQ